MTKSIGETYSGQRVDLLNPDPATIRIEDIAKSLSRICRYNGHPHISYSVAQHCVHCVEYTGKSGEKDPRILLAVLMHDAHEAYFGDLWAPTIHAIDSMAPGVIQYLKDTLQAAIIARLGLVSEDILADLAVEHADGALRTIESSILCVSRGADWENRVRPKVWMHLAPMSDRMAEGMFLGLFHHLCPDYKATCSAEQLGAMCRRFNELRPRWAKTNGVAHPSMPEVREPILQTQGADVDPIVA